MRPNKAFRATAGCVRQFVSRTSPKRVGPDFCAGRAVFDSHRSMARRARGNKKSGGYSRTKTVVAGEDRHNRASGCFAGGGAHADSRICSAQLFGFHRHRHRRRDRRFLAVSARPAARNAGSCELLRNPHAAALPPPGAAPRVSPLLNLIRGNRSFSLLLPSSLCSSVAAFASSVSALRQVRAAPSGEGWRRTGRN